jgi:hypothetical protein
MCAHCIGGAAAEKLKESNMYKMTLREQADILARITATAPAGRNHDAAIEAVRAGTANLKQVVSVLAALQHYGELGTGIARDEALRALEEYEAEAGQQRCEPADGSGLR